MDESTKMIFPAENNSMITLNKNKTFTMSCDSKISVTTRSEEMKGSVQRLRHLRSLNMRGTERGQQADGATSEAPAQFQHAMK